MRRGEAGSGYWEVRVEQAGRYEFTLRRWPAEAGHPVGAGIDGADVPFRTDAIAEADWGLYVGGFALAIETARIEVGAQSASGSLSPRARTLRG